MICSRLDSSALISENSTRNIFAGSSTFEASLARESGRWVEVGKMVMRATLDEAETLSQRVSSAYYRFRSLKHSE